MPPTSSSVSNPALASIVGVFPNAKCNEASDHETLGSILNGIRDGSWARPVEHVRQLRSAFASVGDPATEQEEETWRTVKRTTLPGFTISCDMAHRKKGTTPMEREVRPTELMQGDLDHVADVASASAKLKESPYTVAVWLSPSGDGVKCIARVAGAGDPDRHAAAFAAFDKHLLEIVGQSNDAQVSEYCRLCFVSVDPDLWVRDGEADILQVAPPEPTHREPVQSDDLVVKRAIAYLGRLPPAIQGNSGSNDCMRAAAALVWGFDLNDETAFDLLRNHYHSEPPWSDTELKHKIESVLTQAHSKPRGYLRDAVAPDNLASTEAPKTTPRIVFETHADRLSQDANPTPDVIEDLLPEGGEAVVYAKPGVGKSVLLDHIACCVASGQPFAGKKVKCGRVVIVCTDASRSSKRRLLVRDPAIAERILTVSSMPKLPGCLPDLRDALERLNTDGGDPVTLLCIDTWDSNRAHDAGGYSAQDALVEAAAGGLRQLAADLHLGVLITHHTPKGVEDRMRGSAVFDAKVDSMLSLTGDKRLLLTATKCRDGEKGILGCFDIVPVPLGAKTVPQIRECALSERTKTPLGNDNARVLLVYLASHPKGGGLVARKLAKASGVPFGSFARTVSLLRSQGLMDQDGHGLTEAGIEAADDAILGVSHDADFDPPDTDRDTAGAA